MHDDPVTQIHFAATLGALQLETLHLNRQSAVTQCAITAHCLSLSQSVTMVTTCNNASWLQGNSTTFAPHDMLPLRTPAATQDHILQRVRCIARHTNLSAEIKH